MGYFLVWWNVLASGHCHLESFYQYIVASVKMPLLFWNNSFFVKKRFFEIIWRIIISRLEHNLALSPEFEEVTCEEVDIFVEEVRKVSYSGQFMDRGEGNAFWKTMVKYGVDIYLAGEVYTNIVTKNPESNLLWVVSRGNSFNISLQIKVTNDILSILFYNEIGQKPKNNHNYEVYGDLFIFWIRQQFDPFSDDQFLAEPSVSIWNHTNTAAQDSLTFMEHVLLLPLVSIHINLITFHF